MELKDLSDEELKIWRMCERYALACMGLAKTTDLMLQERRSALDYAEKVAQEAVQAIHNFRRTQPHPFGASPKECT